jgi:hypothetical protein
MTETKTVIGEITAKEDTGDAYGRHVFHIGKQKFSCFDEKIIKSFNVGDHVKITLAPKEKNGKTFWNMINMETATADEIGKAEVVRPGAVQTADKWRTPRQIIKTSAAELAVSYFHLQEQAPNMDSLLRVAEEFFDYFNS